MFLPPRSLRLAWLVLLAACGQSVVGRSPDANTPPTVLPLADLVTDEDTPVSFTVTLDDAESVDVLTISGDSDEPLLVDASSFAFSGTGAMRTVTITPRPDAFGTATVTLTVRDSDAYVTPVDVSFQLTVNPINDPPTIVGLSDRTIDEDGTTGTLSFTVADVDDAVGGLVVSGASSNTTLLPTVTLNQGAGVGVYEYVLTPEADGNGSSTITISVDDGALISTESFVLTVTPVNDAPTMSDLGDLSVDEDVSTGPIAFTVGDIDDDPATLTISAASSDPSVVPVANVVFGGSGTNRTVELVSAQDAFGSSTITITVSDGDLTVTDSFVVTVRPVNDAPLIAAVADLSTLEDNPTGSIAITVSDVDDPLGSLVLSGASSAQAVVADSGLAFGGSGGSRTLVITPVPDANGQATITLTVTDVAGLTATTSFVLTVTSVNDLPTISAVLGQSTDEDVPLVGVAFTVGDVETAPGALVVTASSGDQSLVSDTTGFVLGGVGGNRTLTIAPMPDAFGSTTVTLTVSDGNDSAVTSFVLTVSPVNDAPRITAIGDQTIEEDESTGALPFAISDVDDPLSSLVVVGDSLGEAVLPDAAVVVAGGPANFTVTLTPLPQANTSASGPITVEIRVSDGLLTTVETILLTVAPLNDAPVIDPVADQITLEDTSIVGLGVTLDDVDTPLASITLTASSSDTSIIADAGLVVGGSGGARTLGITPVPDASGVVTITLTANDGVDSTIRTFLVTVQPVDDAPSITAIVNQTIDEDGTTGPLAFVIGDVDSPLASLVVTGASSNDALVPDGAVTITGTRPNLTVTAVPLANQFGTTTITLSVTDGNTTTTTTFVLTVASVNDLPMITAIADQTIDEDGSTPTLSFTVSDVEDASGCALVPSASISTPTLVVPAGFAFGSMSCLVRTLVVSPAANQNGSGTVTVTVTDSNGGQVTETFLLVVNPVNDKPVIGTVASQTMLEDGTLVLSVSVSDVDGTTPTLAATSGDVSVITDAGLVITGSGVNRTLTITPLAEQSSGTPITITLSADDGTGPVTSSFTVLVQMVDDAPVLTDITDQTIAEDGTTGALSFGVTDVDSPPNGTVTVSVSSSNTALVPDANVVLGGSGASSTVTVTPLTDQFGTTTITVTATDGTSTVTDTFVVTVTAVNDLPTITAITDQTILEDGDTGPLAFVVFDAETPLCALSLSATNAPPLSTGTVGYVFGANAGCTASTLTATPATDANGVTTVTVTVTDGDGGSASAVFELTVTPQNDPPVPAPLSTSTTGNVTVTGTVSATDVDSGSLTFGTATGTSANGGIVTVGAGGSFSFTPSPGFVGSDSFAFTVDDGGGPVPGTVTVTVGEPMRWFVDADAPVPPPGQGGTDLHPFQGLDSVETATTTATTEIVVLQAASVAYAPTGGFAMRNGMALLGVPDAAQPTLSPRVAVSGAPAVIVGTSATVTNLEITQGTLGIDADGLDGTLVLTNVDIVGPAVGVFARPGGGDTGSVSLNDVTIEDATSYGLRLVDVTVTTSGTNTVEATAGTALDATTCAFGAGITLGLVSLQGATGTGVSVVDCTGPLTLGTVDVRLSGAGTGVFVDDSSVNLGTGGRIETANGSGLLVSGSSPGSVTIGGTITSFDCTATNAHCVSVVNATSSLAFTTDFAAFTTDTSGGTSESTAVRANGVTGTFSISDTTAGLVRTSNAIAMDLVDVAAADVRIRSVQAVHAGAGLSVVRVGGNVRIEGDATGARNGSGGSIQSTSGTGVVLDRAANVALRSLDLVASGTYGVTVTGATVLALDGVSLDGSASTDAGLRISASSSAVTVRGSHLFDSTRNVDVVETGGTGLSSSLTLIDTRLEDATDGCLVVAKAGNHGFTLSVSTPAAVATRALVSACGASQAAIEVDDDGTGALAVTVDRMDLQGADRGIFATPSAAGAKSLTVTDSVFGGSTLNVVDWTTSGCAGANDVQIRDNTFGANGVNNSTTTDGHGINVFVSGGASCVARHRIQRNNVRGVDTDTFAALRSGFDLPVGASASVAIDDNDLRQFDVNYASSADALRLVSYGPGAPCYTLTLNALSANPGDAAEVYVDAAGDGLQIRGFVTNLAATLIAAANANTYLGTTPIGGAGAANVSAPMSGSCPAVP